VSDLRGATNRTDCRHRCVVRCGQKPLLTFPPSRAPVCWGPERAGVRGYLLDRQHLPVERCAEMLADLLGAQVSTGWLCQVRSRGRQAGPPFHHRAKGPDLGSEPLSHADRAGNPGADRQALDDTLSTRFVTFRRAAPARREAWKTWCARRLYGDHRFMTVTALTISQEPCTLNAAPISFAISSGGPDRRVPALDYQDTRCSWMPSKPPRCGPRLGLPLCRKVVLRMRVVPTNPRFWSFTPAKGRPLGAATRGWTTYSASWNSLPHAH